MTASETQKHSRTPFECIFNGIGCSYTCFPPPHCHRSESYWAVKCEKLQSGICMQGDSLSCQTWLHWDRPNSLDEGMCWLCPVIAVCGLVLGVTWPGSKMLPFKCMQCTFMPCPSASIVSLEGVHSVKVYIWTHCNPLSQIKPLCGTPMKGVNGTGGQTGGATRLYVYHHLIAGIFQDKQDFWHWITTCCTCFSIGPGLWALNNALRYKSE